MESLLSTKTAHSKVSRKPTPKQNAPEKKGKDRNDGHWSRTEAFRSPNQYPTCNREVGWMAQTMT
ncbi:MAG: hypothetical protein WB784_04810 [Rhodanobacteraceae bacterium]